jgi:hypothetical protein
MIIGLIGAPGAGKDEVVAHTLTCQFGFSRFAFADSIKKSYYMTEGITDAYFKSCRGTPEEERIRKGLWEFSDRTRKELGPFFFIDSLTEEMLRHDNAVATDIRTEDELTKMLEIADEILVVVRDPIILEGNENEIFPETRIPKHKIKQFRIFVNDFSTLEEARKNFKEFYKAMGGE